MCAALTKHVVDYTIIRWIGATLKGRLAMETLGELSRSVGMSRSCPVGGVLSPLLWCIFVDELLARLNVGYVYTQGYADDICLLAVGKFPNTVSGLIKWALHTVETWCDVFCLSVNPEIGGCCIHEKKKTPRVL